ncbi:MAG: hypothetical protein ACE5GJ_12925 [Gemmatimonadota bacterium]
MTEGRERRNSPGVVAKFVAEMRHRRVVRATAFYVGGSFAALQAVELLQDPLGLSPGLLRLLTALALAGLPVVVATSWIFDLQRTVSVGGWRRALSLVAVVGVGIASFTLTFAALLPPALPSGEPVAGGETSGLGLAVLPFDVNPFDEKDRDRMEAFGHHLHARLIDGLQEAARSTQGSSSLKVISRAGSLPFPLGAATPQAIGETLDAGTLVEGSVAGSLDPGEAVEVRLRVVDAPTAELLQSTRVRVISERRADLVDAVADSATRILRRALGPVLATRRRHLGTISEDALDRVVWGRRLEEDFSTAFSAMNFSGAKAALTEADSLYAEAEDLDPEWIDPILLRGLLSDPLFRLNQARGGQDRRAIILRGLEHARRALRLDPEDPRARNLRGSLRALLAADPGTSEEERARLWTQAEADLRAAARRHPNPAEPLRRLSEVLASQGRLQEALTYGRQAYEDDPYLQATPAALLRLFQYSLALDLDDEAADWCAEGLRRFTQPMFHDCALTLMAWSPEVPAEPDSAWHLLNAELEAYPAPLRPRLAPRLLGLYAAVLARAGKADSARTVLAAARSRDASSPGMLRVSIGVWTYLEDADSASATLDELLAAPAGGDVFEANAPELREARGRAWFRAARGTFPGHR